MAVSCRRACIQIHTCGASPSSIVRCSRLWTTLAHATPVMYDSLATPWFSNGVMCGKSISAAVVCSLRIPKSFPVARVDPWVLASKTTGDKPSLLIMAVLSEFPCMQILKLKESTERGIKWRCLCARTQYTHSFITFGFRVLHFTWPLNSDYNWQVGWWPEISCCKSTLWGCDIHHHFLGWPAAGNIAFISKMHQPPYSRL